MYCPRCGKKDQKINTFCRHCGLYLLDYGKLVKWVTPPGEHLLANTIMSGMTGIVSQALAIILYTVFLGRAETPVIIYVLAGFLVAIFAWQVQTFWCKLLLKKHLPEKGIESMDSIPADGK